jgi:MFS superfamily sulfate permease-like transporter
MRAQKQVIVFRLIVASLVTFGLLLGMVVGVILAAMVSTGEVNRRCHHARRRHQSRMRQLFHLDLL